MESCIFRDMLEKNHLRFLEEIPFGEDLIFVFQAMPLAKRYSVYQ